MKNSVQWKETMQQFCMSGPSVITGEAPNKRLSHSLICVTSQMGSDNYISVICLCICLPETQLLKDLIPLGLVLDF